jgi:hypothetical protein
MDYIVAVSLTSDESSGEDCGVISGYNSTYSDTTETKGRHERRPIQLVSCNSDLDMIIIQMKKQMLLVFRLVKTGMI